MEVRIPIDARLIQKAIEQSKIRVVTLKDRKLAGKLRRDFGLGMGEAEAIALTVSEKATLIGIDYKNGINACKLLGIPFTTAIGILVRMREKALSTGRLVTAGLYDFCPEVEWRDDLELGATELYFAVQSCGTNCRINLHLASYYLSQAATWANAYITGPNDPNDTLNLYDVSGLAHFELYRAIALAGNPSGLANTQAELVADLQKQLNNAISQSGKDPFGFGFPWNTYDTTSHGGGLAVMGAEYSYLNGPALNNSTNAATYANRQLANILGANGWGTSLIVNDGSTFPLCMQHQVTNLIPNPPNGPPFLSGAAVEGPNSAASKGTLTGMVACPPNGVDQFAQFNSFNAVYKDKVQSYPTVEPAIDLTASSFLAFSWQMAGAPSGTPCLMTLDGLLAVLWFLLLKRRSRRRQSCTDGFPCCASCYRFWPAR